jgi:acyl carrier protein
MTPAARRRAGELGSGVEGAVTLGDVEAAAARAKAPAPAAPAAKSRWAAFDPAEMRKAIAAAMGRAKREIPHYYLGHTIDLGAALAWIETFNSAQPVTKRLLPAVLLLKASALALREVPQLNGTYVDGAFRPGDGIHVGWAITLRGGGLVAPAIRDTDRQSLLELMAAMRDLVQRARSGGLKSSELSSPTDQPWRARRRDRDRDNLSAAGRDHRLWQHIDAALGHRRADRGAAVGGGEPRRRPPGERRPCRRAAAERGRAAATAIGKAMTADEIKALIRDILGGIAPEADLDAVADDEDLREALDLDSMDFLNFVVALHERTGIDIPEADYPQLRTLDGAIAYFEA